MVRLFHYFVTFMIVEWIFFLFSSNSPLLIALLLIGLVKKNIRFDSDWHSDNNLIDSLHEMHRKLKQNDASALHSYWLEIVITKFQIRFEQSILRLIIFSTNVLKAQLLGCLNFIWMREIHRKVEWLSGEIG